MIAYPYQSWGATIQKPIYWLWKQKWLNNFLLVLLIQNNYASALGMLCIQPHKCGLEKNNLIAVCYRWSNNVEKLPWPY